jgi:hypothetical protein
LCEANVQLKVGAQHVAEGAFEALRHVLDQEDGTRKGPGERSQDTHQCLWTTRGRDDADHARWPPHGP